MTSKHQSTEVPEDDNFCRLEPDPEVARRAYELYAARGFHHGHDIDDWLRAERELKQEYGDTVKLDTTEKKDRISAP